MQAVKKTALTTANVDRGASNDYNWPQFLAELRDRRARVLGCEIDRVSIEETLAVCDAVIESRGFAQHMAVNVAKLMAMRDDAQLRAIVAECELVTADGQPVVWASRLLGDPLPSRVAGIDLMNSLLARAAVKGYRIYILGATPHVLERAVERMRAEFPTLVLAGYRDGYFRDDEEAAVAASIAVSRPDILFVAMSSPRKEYFLAHHSKTLGVPFVMGVGGSIDVYAGLRRRAPEAIQRAGLEWLFRLVQEPRRLARRYVETNSRFMVLLATELVRTRTTRRRPADGPKRPVYDDGREKPSQSTNGPAPAPVSDDCGGAEAPRRHP